MLTCKPHCVLTFASGTCHMSRGRYIVKAATGDNVRALGMDAYSGYGSGVRQWSGVGATDLDAESVQELFLRCAHVFAATELPMQVLSETGHQQPFMRMSTEHMLIEQMLKSLIGDPKHKHSYRLQGETRT